MAATPQSEPSAVPSAVPQVIRPADKARVLTETETAESQTGTYTGPMVLETHGLRPSQRRQGCNAHTFPAWSLERRARG